MKTYPLAYPEITQEDIESVTEVLRSQHLSRGPVVRDFERKFSEVLKVDYASAVSSGTAGLIIALQALGVSQNDEVISVSFTVPATVNSIVAIGAKPIMVDIEEQTYGMCPHALELAITKKTKAIIIVHAFGKAAQVKKLIGIAKLHNIKVIEDACEAIGNSYGDKTLGTLADIGVFAFYPNKQITSGEGGMLVTNNEVYYQQFETLKNHGRTMNGDLFDQVGFGWNFRMSDINAALGLSQLRRLDDILTKRRGVSNSYYDNLISSKEVRCPNFTKSEENSAWFVYVVLIDNPDVVKELLWQEKIQTGRYFAPVHLQPFYHNLIGPINLPVTEKIAKQTLALPFYNELKAQDVEYICYKLIKNITNAC